MISALCPSRGRPGLLARAAGSLRDLADGEVEVLVAADADDPATASAARAIRADHVLVSERHGYAGLHRYYNALAGLAAGDWLLLWNDDATMTTAGWDTVIKALPPRVLVADLRTSLSPTHCCFPAVRREAVEAVGGFSPHTPRCDTYWQEMARALGRAAAVDVFVHHDRPDITGNNNDAVYAEARAWMRSAEYEEFWGPETQAAVAADRERLRAVTVTGDQNVCG